MNIEYWKTLNNVEVDAELETDQNVLGRRSS